MKWWKFFKIDFVISFILSFGYMIWRRIQYKAFVNALSAKETVFMTWLTQTIVILVIVFVILFILALIWNIIFGKKSFVHGVAMKKVGERKMAEEIIRGKAMKKMRIKPRKMIKI